MAPVVEYFYDSNGYWRCGDSGWRRWRHHDAAWRGGTSSGRRVWRRDGEEDQRELVEKMNKKMEMLEKKMDEVDELQKRFMQKLEDEGCWRWCFEWRMMKIETMAEQKEQFKDDAVLAKYAKEDYSKVGDELVVMSKAEAIQVNMSDGFEDKVMAKLDELKNGVWNKNAEEYCDKVTGEMLSKSLSGLEVMFKVIQENVKGLVLVEGAEKMRRGKKKNKRKMTSYKISGDADEEMTGTGAEDFEAKSAGVKDIEKNLDGSDGGDIGEAMAEQSYDVEWGSGDDDINEAVGEMSESDKDGKLMKDGADDNGSINDFINASLRCNGDRWNSVVNNASIKEGDQDFVYLFDILSHGSANRYKADLPYIEDSLHCTRFFTEARQELESRFNSIVRVLSKNDPTSGKIWLRMSRNAIRNGHDFLNKMEAEVATLVRVPPELKPKQRGCGRLKMKGVTQR
eukprot:TRINITY_DN13460_c0_g2_i3.p1 TRINITY_DN13460_c0_g2~~TRINITY_DN13460_c0_g2_i3.p1  ORF type:complete len:483 (+),score=149.01 TRINITY_DN13460_c0_g2_i3:90-1451(+)